MYSVSWIGNFLVLCIVVLEEIELASCACELRSKLVMVKIVKDDFSYKIILYTMHTVIPPVYGFSNLVARKNFKDN